MVNEHRFMIDCGEGTQRQILRSGLGFRRLDKILLTHGHLDHILGLGGLASTLGRWEALEELNIYGGAGTDAAHVHMLMEVVFGPNQMPGVGVALNLMEAGLLLEDKNFTLSAFPVQHRGTDCFGFTFEEKTRRPFLPEKAEALGIPRPRAPGIDRRRRDYVGRWPRHPTGCGLGRTTTGHQALLCRRCKPHRAAAQSGCRRRFLGD